MGWLFTYGASKKDIIANVTRDIDHENGATFRTLAKALRGNVLWAVQESSYPKEEGKEPERFIACYLLEKDPDVGWGYKDMDESMHPYYYSCPLSYLDMVPEACPEWREHVRKLAPKKFSIKVGDQLMLNEYAIVKGPLEVVSARPLRAKYGGITYKVKRRLIESVIPA